MDPTQDTSHGGFLGSRTYWTYTDPKTGKQVSSPQPPQASGGVLGVGASTPQATAYREDTYADGTKITYQHDDGSGAWQQAGYAVDPQIRAQYQASQKGNSSSTAQQNADANTSRAATAQAAQTANAANAQARTGIAQENADTAKARADLAAAKQQGSAYLAGLNEQIAQGKLDVAKANQQWKQYYQENIAGPVARAHADAQQTMTEIAQQRANTQQQRADAYGNLSNARADLYGAQTAIAQAKTVQDATQQAIENARWQAENQVSPNAAQQFADSINATNAKAGRPSHYTAQDFMYQMPDQDAIAAKAQQRVMTLLGLSQSRFDPTAGANGQPAAGGQPLDVSAPAAASPPAPAAPVSVAPASTAPAPAIPPPVIFGAPNT